MLIAWTYYGMFDSGHTSPKTVIVSSALEHSALVHTHAPWINTLGLYVPPPPPVPRSYLHPWVSNQREFPPCN